MSIVSDQFLDQESTDIIFDLLILNLNKEINLLMMATYDNHINQIDNTIKVLLKENEQLSRSYDNIVIDRIIILEEQLKIAKAINLKEPSVNKNKDSQKVSVSIQTGVNVYEYLKGYDAIEAEIKTLKNREFKKTFIPNLRANEESILLLRSSFYRDDLLKDSNMILYADNKFNPFISNDRINFLKINIGYDKKFQIFMSILFTMFSLIISILLIMLNKEYKAHKLNK